VAEGIFFVCNYCGKEVESWDEGNPYYRDASGAKHYASHPDPERDLCTGMDSPHLCLNCGAEFPVDSEQPRLECPECSSREIADTFRLDDKRCPYCKEGRFLRDPGRQAIS